VAALFFPPEYRDTPDHALYRSLSPGQRVMIQREFVGVSYLRRFVMLKRRGQRGHFRAEQPAAGRFLHRKQVVSRLVWRRTGLVRNYLELVFRHYLFGFLVQMAGRKHELDLPAAGPGCYWETPVNLVVLRWLNRRRPVWTKALATCLERVLEENIRHHFIYCLRLGVLAAGLYCRAEMAAEAEALRALSLPGKVPLGLELEFSNLGRRAVDKECPAALIEADPFHNFEYYDSFHLEDVTWRLGGYVDTHEHGRRLFSLTRYGGFFEYSLVRVDYPRTYTLPLTTDPAVAAAMIRESIAFIPEIAPHSLHVNIESSGSGPVVPQVNDYLCLLLLGGDLAVDESGRLRERRLADREFTRFVKLRRHISLVSEEPEKVVEFAFLRLRRDFDYLPLILTLKGFQASCRFEAGTRELLPALVDWACHPVPLPVPAVRRFVDLVERGLKREGVYDAAFRARFRARLGDLLERRQELLRGLPG